MLAVCVSSLSQNTGMVMVTSSLLLLDEIIDRGIAVLVEIVDAFEPDHGGDAG